MHNIFEIFRTAENSVMAGIGAIRRDVGGSLRYKHIVKDCGTYHIHIGEFLVGRFVELGYDAQVFRFSDKNEVGTFVQIRNKNCEWKRNALRSILGQQLSINVRMLPVANDLQVEIDNGKWVDKTLSGVLAWTFFAPLMAAPVIGVYRQKILADHVIDEMNLWLSKNWRQAMFEQKRNLD